MIGLYEAGIGHVHVPILKNNRALRTDKAFQAKSRLRHELNVAAEFGRAVVQACAQQAGANIQERDKPAMMRPDKAKKHGIP